MLSLSRGTRKTLDAQDMLHGLMPLAFYFQDLPQSAINLLYIPVQEMGTGTLLKLQESPSAVAVN